MKKYFVRLLPDRSKIKKGDLVIFTDIPFMPPTIVTHITRDNLVTMDDGNKSYAYNLTKMSLFLCSRDIQVGDKVYGNIESNEEYTFTEKMDRSLCFKVIGRISSKASWIKDGNELDENEVVFLAHGGMSARLPMSKWDQKYADTCKIFVKGKDNDYH